MSTTCVVEPVDEFPVSALLYCEGLVAVSACHTGSSAAPGPPASIRNSGVPASKRRFSKSSSFKRRRRGLFHVGWRRIEWRFEGFIMGRFNQVAIGVCRRREVPGLVLFVLSGQQYKSLTAFFRGCDSPDTKLLLLSFFLYFDGEFVRVSNDRRRRSCYRTCCDLPRVARNQTA